jgi:tetratricopeptide (TPR) repeat protein
LFQEIGEEHYVLWATRTLAWAYAEFGNLARGRALYEDALRRARTIDNKPAEAALLGSLAWLAVNEGRAPDALPLLKESLSIKRDLGDRVEIATGLSSAARAMTRVGRVTPATQLIACFEALREEIGGSEAWVTRMNEETLPAIRRQLDEVAFAEAWDQGRKLTIDQAVALALDALD